MISHPVFSFSFDHENDNFWGSFSKFEIRNYSSIYCSKKEEREIINKKKNAKSIEKFLIS
jgi:hypothetical protein